MRDPIAGGSSPDEVFDHAVDDMGLLDIDGTEFGIGRRVAREFIEGGQRYWTTARRSAKAKKQLRHWKTKKWIKSRLNFDFPEFGKEARARTDVGVENVDVDVPNVALDAVDVSTVDDTASLASVALDTSKDVLTRHDALRRLGLKNVEDPSAENQQVFRQIALQDDSPKMVAEAIGWLDDPDAQVEAFQRDLLLRSDEISPGLMESIPADRMGELYSLALPDDVRETIAQYATDQVALSRIALHPLEWDEISMLAASRITDEKTFAEVAKKYRREESKAILDIHRITDPEILKDIVLSADPTFQTKIKALTKITDQEFLQQLLADKSMADLHWYALQNYKGQEGLLELARTSQYDSVRSLAFDKLEAKDEDFLKEVALGLNPFDMKKGALKDIVDQAFLADFVRSSSEGALATVALEGINSDEMLQELLSGPPIKSPIEDKILERIKDQNFLKESFLTFYKNYSSSPEYYRRMMLAAARGLTDQGFIRDLSQLALPDKIQDELLSRVQSIGDLDQRQAMRVARLSKSTDVIKEALQHPSPNVRASALVNRHTRGPMVRELLQGETDSRVAELAQALYPEDPDEDSGTGMRRRFMFTPDQIVAGVQALMPQEGALQRAPSITTQPMVLAGLIRDFFDAELPEKMKGAGSVDIEAASLAKGLVAERISDALQDIPLQDIMSLVEQVMHEPNNIYHYAFLEPVDDPAVLEKIAGINDQLGYITLMDVLDGAQQGPSMRMEDSLSMDNGRTYLITDRSNGSIQVVSFPEGQQPLVSGPGSLSVALIGTPEAETMIRDNLSSRMINWWANSSNDRHDGSLAVQEAARRVLNPDNTELAGWPMDPSLKAMVDKLSAEHGNILDRFITAQHNNTQRLLAGLGLPSVTLFRGAGEGGHEGPSTSLFLRRGVDGTTLFEESLIAEDAAELRLRPASAWAWAPDIAADFGNAEGDTYLFAGEFPAHMLIATPLTGAGCFQEKEFVMAGNQEPVAVFRKSMFMSGHQYDETILDTLVPGNPGNLVVNPDNNDSNADWILSVLAADEARDQRIEELFTELDVPPGDDNPVESVENFDTRKPEELMRELIAYEQLHGSVALVDRLASLPPNMRNQFFQKFIGQIAGTHNVENLRDRSIQALRETVQNASPAELELYNAAVRALTEARAKRTVNNFNSDDLGLDAVDIGHDDLFVVPDVFQSGGEDERLAAAETINGTPQNQPLLQHIAGSDDSDLVRAAAIKKISDQQFLLQTALQDKSISAQDAAIGGMTDPTLVELAKHASGWLQTRLAISKLKQQEDLIDVARNASRTKNRVEAVRHITDQAFLNNALTEEISDTVREAVARKLASLSRIEPLDNPGPLLVAAKSDPSGYVRLAALEGINDQDVLIDRLLHDPYLNVREFAVDGVVDEEVLAAVAKNDLDQGVRILAVRRINDEELLKEIYDTVVDEDVQYAALRNIKDEKWLRDLVLRMDPEDGSSYFLGPRAVEGITDQQVLASIAEQSPIEDIVRRAVQKLEYDPAFDEKVLRKILEETTEPAVIEQAITHPSPSVRAAALISPISTMKFREQVAATDPDPRVRQLAAALNRGYVSRRGRFVFTPEQIVAGTKALLPGPGSAPRSPSVTAQPRVVAALINEFFHPSAGRVLPVLTVDDTISIASLAKGLVAERLTDATRDVPLSGLLSLVRDVSSMSPLDDDYEALRIKSMQGTEILSDIISGIDRREFKKGIYDATRYIPFKEGVRHFPIKEGVLTEELITNGDGRTFLVLDRTNGLLRVVQYPEGEELPVPGAGTTSAALLGTPEAETLARDYLSSRIIEWWAQTSNDSHVGSLAIQQTANYVLGGVTGARTAGWNSSEMLRDQVDQLITRHSEALEAVVGAQYENTQRLLAALGVAEVPLFRGAVQQRGGATGGSMFLRRSADGSLQPTEEPILGEQAELLLRPLSAWAFDPSVATEFTRIHSKIIGEDPYLFGGKIPATHVFSTPLTGCGCFEETEFVVVGNDEPVLALGEQEGRSLTSSQDLQNVIEAMVVGSPSGAVLNPDNSDRNADWVLSVLDAHETSEQVVEQLKQELLGGPTGEEAASLLSPSAARSPAEELLRYLEEERGSGRTGAVDRVAALPATMRNRFLRELQDLQVPSSTPMGGRIGMALRAARAAASPAERAAYDAAVRVITARRATLTGDDLDAVDIGMVDDLDAVDIGGAPKQPVFGPEVEQFPYEVRHGTEAERMEVVRGSDDQRLLTWVAVNDQSPSLRQAAVERTTDQAALEWFAVSGDQVVNDIATGRITDQDRLVRLITSNDPDVGLKVKRRAVQRLHDQQLIQGLLEQLPLPAMAKELLRKVGSREVLERFAGNANNPIPLRQSAIALLANRSGPEAVYRFALHDPSADIRDYTLMYIDDEAVLAEVARNERDPRVRREAIRRVSDEAFLASIAEGDPDWIARKAALQNISDRDVLLRVAANDVSPDVQLVAVQKLSAPGAFGRLRGVTGPLTREQQERLAEVAVLSSDDRLWNAALEIIEDQAILTDIVLSPDSSLSLQLKALGVIDDKDFLGIVLSESGEEEVRQLALRRSMPVPARGSGWDMIGYEPIRLDSPLEAQVERMLSDLYQRYASNFEDSDSEEDFRAGIMDAIRGRLMGTPMVGFSEDTLLSILLTGAVKTQFETGSSNGLLSPKVRNVAERDRLGVPEWIDPSLRPVYGSLEDDPDYPLTNGNYGNMYFFVHDKALARATVTGVDSLDHSDVIGLPFNRVYEASDAELVAAAGSVGLDMAYDAYSDHYGYGIDTYAEIQIHGGLPLDDVKELWFKLEDVVSLTDLTTFDDRIERGEARNVLVDVLSRFGFDFHDPDLFASIPGLREALTAATAALEKGDFDVTTVLQHVLNRIVQVLGYNFIVTVT